MNRNINIIRHIISYCLRIEDACQRFGDSLETLAADFDYKSTVAMYVLQIGELSNHLSKDFRLAHDNIPWRDIIDMRNIAAHHYTKFNAKTLWETRAVQDILGATENSSPQPPKLGVFKNSPPSRDAVPDDDPSSLK